MENIAKSYVLYSPRMEVFFSLEKGVVYYKEKLHRATHFESFEKAEETLHSTLNNAHWTWKVVETVANLPKDE